MQDYQVEQCPSAPFRFFLNKKNNYILGPKILLIKDTQPLLNKKYSKSSCLRKNFSAIHDKMLGKLLQSATYPEWF